MFDQIGFSLSSVSMLVASLVMIATFIRANFQRGVLAKGIVFSAFIAISGQLMPSVVTSLTGFLREVLGAPPETARPSAPPAHPAPAPAPVEHHPQPAGPTSDWSAPRWLMPVCVAALTAVVVGAALWAAAAAARRAQIRRRLERDHLAAEAAKETQRVVDAWRYGKRVYDEVKAAYADFLFTPQRWVEQPDLNDNRSCRETMAFLDAFNDAAALDTETAPDSLDYAQRFETAAKAARTAWRTADSVSRRNGARITDKALRTKLDKAKTALDLAFDTSAGAGERRAAMQAVQRLMEDVVPVPQQVQNGFHQELDTGKRILALPPGEDRQGTPREAVGVRAGASR